MANMPPRVVRFVSVVVQQGSDARCRARVELRNQDGRLFAATVEGGCAELETLQTAAQAAADAVIQAVGEGEDGLKVDGLAITEAFGERTVFVQVSAFYWRQRRELLGFCLIEADSMRAAALAVLNATNRFLCTG